MYSATAFYVVIYHRHDIMTGLRSLKKGLRNPFSKKPVEQAPENDEDDLVDDIHNRLMRSYPEVPEWMYLIVLLIAMVCGMVGVGVYPTHVSPAVVIFGIIMPLIVIIPCGLVQAITGMPIPLNVIAEFIGGAIVPGNANSLIYFKTYGYIAAYQALAFSGDLKLAHYLKINPRHTFAMQIWATLIYCFVCCAIQNFVLGFHGVCTSAAKFGMSCPSANTFFTSAVFWGTIGPKRLFGPGKRYNLMLLGFPAGAVAVIFYWALRKKFPRSEWMRQIHPVMIFSGAAYWGAPYNMSYFIGNLWVTLFSFQFLRKRYTAFWAKYNYVLAAAFPAAIAVAAIIIFFGTAIAEDGKYSSIDWWGTNVVGRDTCDNVGCPRLALAEGDVFGAPVNSGRFT
jgi:OPT family oligopeptide transporter